MRPAVLIRKNIFANGSEMGVPTQAIFATLLHRRAPYSAVRGSSSPRGCGHWYTIQILARHPGSQFCCVLKYYSGSRSPAVGMRFSYQQRSPV